MSTMISTHKIANSMIMMMVAYCKSVIAITLLYWYAWLMDWLNVGSLIVGGIGVLLSAVALLQSRKANKLAERAARVSEEANRIAITANRLAGEANEISADAKLISQRAVDVSADQTVYDWRVKFDYETALVTIVNNSPYPARDVSVIISNKDETLAEHREESITAVSEFSFHAPLIVEQIVKNHQVNISMLRNGYFTNRTDACVATVRIDWTTEFGTHRTSVLKHSFSNRNRS